MDNISIRYSEDGCTISAYDATWRVGWLELDFRDNTTAEIVSFGVEIQYQGSGIGTLLLKKAIKLVKYNEFRCMTVVSAYDYEAAMHLYEKFGFVIVGEDENLIFMEMKL